MSKLVLYRIIPPVPTIAPLAICCPIYEAVFLRVATKSVHLWSHFTLAFPIENGHIYYVYIYICIDVVAGRNPIKNRLLSGRSNFTCIDVRDYAVLEKKKRLANAMKKGLEFDQVRFQSILEKRTVRYSPSPPCPSSKYDIRVSYVDCALLSPHTTSATTP